MTAFYAGMGLSFSLIMAIGAQNAFVLKQGLRREHVFIVCLVCASSDALMISAGVFGFHTMQDKLPWLESVARYGGAAFVFIYGALSFRNALRPPAQSKLPTAGTVLTDSAMTTASTALMFTWLNPHAYLDTVVLLGSLSTQYPHGKIPFAIGALLASFMFFFTLGYAARMLQPFFRKPSAWKILDAFIGCMMWFIAASLVLD